MPLIQPDGEVRLLNVPFDPSYENTMRFSSRTQQTNWFINRTERTYSGISYTRKSRNTIKVEDTIANTYDANYMMFINTGFEGKWFYAFVENVEYINNITVEITYTIDVIQTWMFDYTFNECFIERQHSITDTPGDNTIPENFELGEYISSPTFQHHFTPCIVLVSTCIKDDPNTPGGYIVDITSGDNFGVMYAGRNAYGSMYSGVTYAAFPLTNNVADQINLLLKNLSTANKSEAVVAIFMGAYEFFSGNNEVTISLSLRTEVNGVTGYFLGDYSPRNKKLMTAPYNFLQLTDLDGHSNNYHFELFDNPLQITFKCWGNKGGQPGVIAYPENYKGKVIDADEAVTLNNFPLCTWSIDSFKAWLAQNWGTLTARGFEIGTALLTPTANPLAKTVKKAGAIGATAELIGQVYDHATKPATVHGNNNGNIMFQAGFSLFEWTHKHIKPEYANIIDSFFDMYGYAQHKIGTPNIFARPKYTYVKTVGCSIDGNVPASDERKIEEIFDTGIRFWDVTATFGVYNDYVNPNSPVGGGA